jgi:hypothetical protein
MSQSSVSTNAPATSRRFIWSLTLRDALLVALIADLVVLGKVLINVPLHVPGHTGAVVVALFVVGRGIVGRRGAGRLMGLLAGVLLTLLGHGHAPFLEWVKYVAMGLTVDLGAAFLPGGISNKVSAAVIGALANLAKLITTLIIGVILKLPLGFLFWGLGYAATTHVVFGAIGGLLGVLLVAQLRKIPGVGA